MDFISSTFSESSNSCQILCVDAIFRGQISIMWLKVIFLPFVVWIVSLVWRRNEVEVANKINFVACDTAPRKPQIPRIEFGSSQEPPQTDLPTWPINYLAHCLVANLSGGPPPGRIASPLSEDLHVTVEEPELNPDAFLAWILTPWIGHGAFFITLSRVAVVLVLTFSGLNFSRWKIVFCDRSRIGEARLRCGFHRSLITGGSVEEEEGGVV